MIVARTQRLILRELRTDDLDDMAAMLGDPRVMTHYSHVFDRAEALAWIDRNIESYRSEGFGSWLLRRVDTGAFVGDCGLARQRVDGVSEVEVGYRLRHEQQGRGFATEAVSASRELAANRFGLRRLIALIRPQNTPSQAVALRIGLAVEKRTVVFGSEHLVFAAALSPHSAVGGQPAGSARPAQ